MYSPKVSDFGRSSFQAHSSCFRDKTSLPWRRMILSVGMFGDRRYNYIGLRNEGVIVLIRQEKVALKDQGWHLCSEDDDTASNGNDQAKCPNSCLHAHSVASLSNARAAATASSSRTSSSRASSSRTTSRSCRSGRASAGKL